MHGNSIFLGFGGFLALMAILMAIPTLAVYEHQKKCTVKVRGKCVSLSGPRDLGIKSSTAYFPTYEIEYQGKKITVTRTVGKTDGRVKLNETYDLYIDPNNPQNFVNKQDNEQYLGTLRLTAGFGVGAIIMLGLYLITFLT